MLFNEFDIRDVYRAGRGHRLFFRFPRFCNGPASSSSSTKETENNQQTTVGDTGTGATAVASGSNSTGNITVSEEDIDPAVITAAGNQITATAIDAVAGESSTAAAALSLGAQTVADNSALAATAVNSSAALAASTVNAIAATAVAGQEDAQASVIASDTSLEQIASDLAQITAATAPQTAATEAETLAGTSDVNPDSLSSSTTNSWATWATIGGFALVLYVFLTSKGKSA
jgi:hypothetical protein